MPAKSKAQANLMRAAEHGADFPAARRIRESMSLGGMRDFARGPMAGKPEHVKTMRKHNPIKNLGKHAHPRKRR